MILSNNERSYEYLKLFVNKKLFPNFIIYLDSQNNKNFKNKIFLLIKKKKLKYKSFKSDNIDRKKIKNYLFQLKEKIIVYSGYGGKIIKSKSIFKNKILLHSHSGKLPKYKGSTTIYYSLLEERKIFCTTFIMNPQIDSGKILLVKKYLFKKNYKNIDKFDCKIRANNMLQTIINFFKLKKKTRKFKGNYSPYYIIHPILRFLSIKNTY